MRLRRLRAPAPRNRAPTSRTYDAKSVVAAGRESHDTGPAPQRPATRRSALASPTAAASSSRTGDRRHGAGPALRPTGARAARCPRPAGFVLGDDLCRPNPCAGGITESAKLRFASSRSRGSRPVRPRRAADRPTPCGLRGAFGLLETRLLKAPQGKDAGPASDLKPGAPLCHEA